MFNCLTPTKIRVTAVSAIVILFAFLTGSVAEAAIINIPDDQATIQAGIDQALEGDTVLVAPGHYLENIDYRGKEIVVSSHLMLDQNPAHIFNTVIDGSTGTDPDSSSTVIMICAVGLSPVLQGFTVTGGTGTRLYDPYEHAYYRHGGGIVTDICSPVIRFNYIHSNALDNYTVGGGGIFVQRGVPEITNNIVMNNYGRYGAGMGISYANSTLRNNVVAHNFGGALWGGSGIYPFRGYHVMENNTVVYNVSGQGGGGIRLAACDAVIRNTISWYNEAPQGAQLYLISGASASVEYSNLQGGWDGVGNVDADPELNGDWMYLLTGSPCIDAGNPAPEYNDHEAPWLPGLARWPSKGDLRNDIGAWGGQGVFALEWFHIVADPAIGWLPLDVSFEAESYFDLDACVWDFGDGATAEGLTAGHLYETMGAHDVTMTVDYDGTEQEIWTEDSAVIVIADSLIGDQIETHHHTCEFSVRVVNTVPLTRLALPVEWTSTDLQLSLLTASTTGCRTEALGSLSYLHYDPQIGKKFTIEFPIDESNPLPPGDGPILRLQYEFENPDTWGRVATVSLSGYDSWMPEIESSQISLYSPFIEDGSIVYSSCCIDRAGNIDNDPGDEVDLSDLTKLIDYLFISFEPPSCIYEANTDGSEGGDIDLGDLTALIDYLFISFSPPAECL